VWVVKQYKGAAHALVCRGPRLVAALAAYVEYWRSQWSPAFPLAAVPGRLPAPLEGNRSGLTDSVVVGYCKEDWRYGA